MHTFQIRYFRQAVISSIFSVALIMAVHTAVMPVVSAQEKELPSEIQVDILISAAKKDILAGRWKDAVQVLEQALKLGVKLPGEYHFHYGKALFKTGNYDDSLSSLTSYLTLVGKVGEYYDEAVTLVVDAKNELEEAKLRSSVSKHQRTEAADETEDDMVYIKGGCFDMGDIFGDGSSDENPVHTVCVSDFYLGKTEVTQKQWTDIMGHNPSKFKCGDCPVERVSWNNVQDFIKKLNKATGLNYRLPTEAEWEYAARSGGEKEKWAGADKESELDEYAWYRGNSKSITHTVAGKSPSKLGLYDMMGNVWEWCSDWYDRKYYKNSPAKNPEGPSDGTTRVLRGGGWKSKPEHLRTVDRNDFVPTSKKFANIGFRLARDP
ncbi:MAG: Hercynine oxygenase [Candidatus Scalindua arabica]|uniref:Hercynine oxygenase n=1 Tax=Candidatus Scalindua arabica TaxID=1127984 RepID=A0A942A6W5_9BACT|nr:Hercynine oxygenase [Candidatus Scalindua arabica]